MIIVGPISTLKIPRFPKRRSASLGFIFTRFVGEPKTAICWGKMVWFLGGTPQNLRKDLFFEVALECIFCSCCTFRMIKWCFSLECICIPWGFAKCVGSTEVWSACQSEQSHNSSYSSRNHMCSQSCNLPTFLFWVANSMSKRLF